MPKDAGTYQVVVDVYGSPNFNDLATPVTKDFTISQLGIDVHWTTDSLMYNGEEQKPTAYVKGAVYDTLNVTVTVNKLSIAVDNYIATAVLDNDNYFVKATTRELPFSIIRRIVTIPSNMSVTYTGYVINPITSTFYHMVYDGEVKVAKTYNIQVALTDNENYIWSDETTTNKPVTLVVNPKDINDKTEITVNPIPAQNYTGYEVILDNELIVVTRGEVPLVNGTDYTVSYQDNVDAFSGSNYAKLILTGEGNYTGTRIVEFKVQSLVFSLESGSNAKFFRYINGKYQQEEHIVRSSTPVYISYVHSRQTITQFLQMFGQDQRDRVTVRDANGNFVKVANYSSVMVGTGFKLELNDNSGKIIDEIYVVIYGDLNGDGIISAADATLITNYLNGKATFNEFQTQAADVNHDGKVNKSDRTMIKDHNAGSLNIEEGY